ncbi:aminotransferase class III-fold pyridoxal phosphate-dependent enzyme [Pricia sp. S334]|uniref:Aminotransferase class III-fold pyridoxal phosphate-dependent enzyme n=1 Tax=Pricia mediterranea TaxID=3076079 RepID=A0ABU3L7N0_9FLAO|nr:aminotransferase class III-fold pyridoxal phosphate-dependent enzyme [Pricia sp. S334]MDT7829223.1 aminotransferase class III-fold pyridoxal phosphate-dependent enzyme [Pricia sp. S334]
MKLFDVYPLYDVTPVSAEGIVVTDDKGQEYLDFYGGHAVISIGHSHPRYVKRLKDQLDNIGFYSNSVKNPLQAEVAEKLGRLSGCGDYNLFLCNSGAEANENALKLASFHTGKSRVIAFDNSFHGRTSAAVAVTDNPKINAPINRQQKVTFLPFNDGDALKKEIEKGDVCAVIFEAVQGVGGLDEPSTEFYRILQKLCNANQVVLIADEVQSGFGRTGKFFGFQHHNALVESESNIDPDIISIAKGMGNGFPVGGILIHKDIKASYGLLGTTFGGNHLACAATLAVLEVLVDERLIENAKQMEGYFRGLAADIPQIKKVKGRGLMLGLEFDFEVAELRKRLIDNQHLFTGGAKNKHLLRVLPALNVTERDLDVLFEGLKNELQNVNQ